jgi:aspartate/tyrosine/aromatic aminotransferase
MAAVSTFQVVEPAPPDAVFNVLTLYKEDTNEQKVNLSVGGE